MQQQLQCRNHGLFEGLAIFSQDRKPDKPCSAVKMMTVIAKNFSNQISTQLIADAARLLLYTLYPAETIYSYSFSSAIKAGNHNFGRKKSFRCLMFTQQQQIFI